MPPATRYGRKKIYISAAPCVLAGLAFLILKKYNNAIYFPAACRPFAGRGLFRKEAPPMAGYIAGIGGANVDIHGQSDAPIVMRDSNPGRLHLSAGGVCRNICDNLCRLGLTVELCSAVGGDAYGDMLRGACTAAGIGTRHLAVFPAQNTSAYISIMDSEGDMLVAMSDMHILKRPRMWRGCCLC